MHEEYINGEWLTERLKDVAAVVIFGEYKNPANDEIEKKNTLYKNPYSDFKIDFN